MIKIVGNKVEITETKEIKKTFTMEQVDEIIATLNKRRKDVDDELAKWHQVQIKIDNSKT